MRLRVKALHAIRHDPRVLARFWDRVEKSADQDGCWDWKGRVTPDGYPSFQVGQGSIAPSHVAWLWSTGDLPLGGRVRRLCENALCVRPSHLAWIVGRLMERRLATETDGYLHVPGIRVPIADAPTGSPQVLRLAASRDDNPDREHPDLMRSDVGKR
jgi:hypothetical protein